MLSPGAHQRHGDHRQQRGGLRLVLPEAEDQRESEHGEDPAADAEQPGRDAGREAESEDAEHLDHSSSPVAIPTSSSAKPRVIQRVGIRCCSQVPATTPATAGRPIATP